LDEHAVPRTRKVPRQLNDGHPAHQPASVADHYRPDIFRMIYSCLSNVVKYFTANDTVEVESLSNLFKDSVEMDDMICKYPELDDSVKLQLVFFRSQFKKSTLTKVHREFKAMQPRVRKMCSSVQKLLGLCVISPATSCTAEGTFSAQDLSTLTMTQARLNHVIKFQFHNDNLSKIPGGWLSKLFVNSNFESRSKTFC